VSDRRRFGSKAKGSRGELEVVRALQAEGIAAEKQPLSGALGGRWKSDISAPILGQDITLQCKWKADGFKTLYDLLEKEGDYGLCLRANRKPWLIVLRLDDFAYLARLSDEDRLLCLANGVCPE
jgi:hypothetical protein